MLRSSAAARAAGVLLTVSVATGCVSPRIQVVDERTALENQILGAYERLDDDLQLMASVRATEASEPGPARHELRRQAIWARRLEIFFRDDVDELKRAGCLGEGRDGLLARRPCEPDGDERRAAWLERVLQQVNEAREKIFEYIVASSHQLAPEDLEQVRGAFVRLRREEAERGEWLQQDDGSWVQR